MGLKTYITSSRNDFSFDLRDSSLYWSLSSITYTLYRDVNRCISNLAIGDVLDAGSGGLNGKIFFKDKCRSYTSLDIQNRTGEVDIVGDIQDMKDIESERFDTVFCSQVLEHVPEPAKAISELYRVLKKQGTCIMSVPHISHYHETPNDYNRYTEYGITYLLVSAGFQVKEVKKQSSLCGLLKHPISIVLVTTFWRIPILKWLLFYLNKFFIVIPAFVCDKFFPVKKLYPQNILIIA